MTPTTVLFKHSKETQTKQRYDADADAAVTGSIYVPKEVAGNSKTMQVVISPVA